LPGNQILEIALAVLVEVKDQIGGKFVIVECEDHLVSMYQSEKFGFRLFNTSSKKRKYNQLFRTIYSTVCIDFNEDACFSVTIKFWMCGDQEHPHCS